MATDAEKVKKLEEAYEAFMKSMSELRGKRLDLAKKIVGRIEQKKLKELLDSLK